MDTIQFGTITVRVKKGKRSEAVNTFIEGIRLISESCLSSFENMLQVYTLDTRAVDFDMATGMDEMVITIKECPALALL